MDSYGIKVSQDGYDVLTCPEDKLVFSSKYDTPKVIATVNARFTIGVNETQSPEVQLSLPASFLGTRPYGIGFVELNGVKRRTNVNRSGVTDWLDCYIYTDYVDTPQHDDIPILRTWISRDSISTTYPGAYTTTLKFFVLV